MSNQLQHNSLLDTDIPDYFIDKTEEIQDETKDLLGSDLRMNPETKKLGDYKNITSSAKIIIISDDAINAEVIESFLTEYGFNNFIFISDINNAYEAIVQNHPDAILYDNNELLPETFSSLEQIMNNTKSRLVPLMILTADCSMHSKLKLLEMGVIDIIEKPVPSNELSLRLRNILSVKTLQDHIANYDALTNLPKRETLLSRLERGIKYAQRYKTIGAVLYIGLNRVNSIYDTLGITVGDQLLKEVAKRIQNMVRDNDIISRVDEFDIETTISRSNENGFLILLPIIRKASDAAIVSLRILEKINAIYTIEDNDFYIECNAGISIFPDDGYHKEPIIHAASIALNKAKSDSNTNYIYYSKELNDLSSYRVTMENNIRKALDKNQFEIYYQPKLSIKTNEIIGAEALIRWPHPELGFISPDDFIPIAEESNDIYEIGSWIIETVIQQIKSWKQSGLIVPRIAINISSYQFKNNKLLTCIEEALSLAGVNGSGLTIELTETAYKEDVEEIARILSQLKELGAKISIDDFGTGYSSLIHLKQLPLDEIKIDRLFTMDINQSMNTEAIILGIIAMAHELGLKVVAEGVENEQQLDFLLQNNCDYYQGYIYSPAINANKFGTLLAQVS